MSLKTHYNHFFVFIATQYFQYKHPTIDLSVYFLQKKCYPLRNFFIKGNPDAKFI